MQNRYSGPEQPPLVRGGSSGSWESSGDNRGVSHGSQGPPIHHSRSQYGPGHAMNYGASPGLPNVQGGNPWGYNPPGMPPQPTIERRQSQPTYAGMGPGRPQMPPQAGWGPNVQLPQPAISNSRSMSSHSGSGKTKKKVDHSKPIKLAENHQMEMMYKDMADMFTIISATEDLETAWRRKAINDSDYERECWNLINRFKATREAVKDSVPDIRRFIEEYAINAKSASKRLLETGMPATVSHGDGKASHKEGQSKNIASAVHSFISTADGLRLNLTAVDQIQPEIVGILENLNKLSFVPPDFEGKVRLREWHSRLNKMKASDNLGEAEARQLLYDIDRSYDAFHRLLDE
mmetsp:Transcript_11131/g.34118  ORF Transcript_11131/g.34118 Transcript_11131/m.34118 type:complete len:348 (-) Transcript_11131:208-1251(-)|eukprot:CAMPEP_0198736674 /NCGR_PEP_ID=MMETSP1475-20131203/67464_1 /TAXON_ID= ORGANISM="Unidentified sp., Strain CCMP1999" /NCGR_SAMPLE_ID=MMETSP1475 /ASSEMBLY_ACC=CAM_ASM_001111 /LENGTH=347 /DNA_ID=CAMNT_0044500523 /DNA_START=78 /DNA_END=1121 /DNA_ORIENTATION=-